MSVTFFYSVFQLNKCNVNQGWTVHVLSIKDVHLYVMSTKDKLSTRMDSSCAVNKGLTVYVLSTKNDWFMYCQPRIDSSCSLNKGRTVHVLSTKDEYFMYHQPWMDST